MRYIIDDWNEVLPLWNPAFSLSVLVLCSFLTGCLLGLIPDDGFFVRLPESRGTRKDGRFELLSLVFEGRLSLLRVMSIMPESLFIKGYF